MGSPTLKMARMVLLSLALVTLYLAQPTLSWCTTAGGVGEYSKKCPSSVDFDAYDNPTHTHDAICILDECFCVFDACPYGRLMTSPICCTKGTGGATINCHNYCDNYPEDC